MGEMATACGVINSGAAAGQAPLAAVGTMLSYMYNSSGAGGWCYNFTFNPDFSILPNAATGYNSYTYQCCAQATVYSSELPARGHDGTLNPHKIPVTVQEIEDNCR